MANGHISRRINLLRDGFCAAVIIPGRRIKRCALGFVSRKDKATITIRRVGQVHKLIADPLNIGRQRKAVVIA